MANFKSFKILAILVLVGLAGCEDNPNDRVVPRDPPTSPQAGDCVLDHAIDLGIADPRIDPHGNSSIQIVDVVFDHEILSDSIPETKRKNLKVELFQVKYAEAWSGFLGASISNVSQSAGDWVYTAGFSYAYDQDVQLKGSVDTEGEDTVYRTSEIPIEDAKATETLPARTNAVLAGIRGTQLVSLAITIPVYKSREGSSGSRRLVYAGSNETLCLKRGRLAAY